jgi:hypothetical protein
MAQYSYRKQVENERELEENGRELEENGRERVEDWREREEDWREQVEDEREREPFMGIPPADTPTWGSDTTTTTTKPIFNYEAARDDWIGNSAYDVSNAEAARNSARIWADKHGIFYDGIGDSINLPNGGGWIDIIGNFGGGAGNGMSMARNWTPAGGNGSNPNGQTSGGGNGSNPNGQTAGGNDSNPNGQTTGGNGSNPNGPTTGGNGSNPNGPPPAGVSEELYNMLMGRAKQGTAIDKNDLNIRQQVEPYAAAQERARRNYLADAAERGGPLANLRGEERLAMERSGQATGLFESQLIGRELENRRAEIQHALDSLGNRLSEDQRLALQKELGYLNDATQRYGVDTNRRIAEGQLGLQKELGYLNDATQRYGVDANRHTAEGQLGLGRDRLGLDYSQFDWSRDPRNPQNWNF